MKEPLTAAPTYMGIKGLAAMKKSNNRTMTLNFSRLCPNHVINQLKANICPTSDLQENNFAVNQTSEKEIVKHNFLRFKVPKVPHG